MAKKAPYIVIAFSIAGMLSILSYFDAYEKFEYSGKTDTKRVRFLMSFLTRLIVFTSSILVVTINAPI